jgi:microcystin-dependent protein
MLCCLAIFLSGACKIYAQGEITVPGDVNFQGTLFKADGKTAMEGPVDLEVRLYDAKDDEPFRAIWGETHTNVALFEGIFNILLSQGDPLSPHPHNELSSVFPGEDEVWIGITVVSEGQERAGRQRFVTDPYALTADRAVNATHGVPPGSIAIKTSALSEPPPVGWLRCNGDEVNISAYPMLYAALGNAWGPASPEGKFNLPNFEGRALMGENVTKAGDDSNTSGQTPASAGLTNHALGDLLGEGTHTLTKNEMPAHSHGGIVDYWANTEENIMTGQSPQPARDLFDDHPDTDPAGGGTPHENMQPSIVTQFIIKY